MDTSLSRTGGVVLLGPGQQMMLWLIFCAPAGVNAKAALAATDSGKGTRETLMFLAACSLNSSRLDILKTNPTTCIIKFQFSSKV